MLVALTRGVSPNLSGCEVTFIQRQPFDLALAMRQHEAYCAALGHRRVTVKALPADPGQPDCCFVEDAAIVVDELAVITTMGTAARRGETPAIEAELQRHRELAHISLPATLDGGDVLRVGKTVFVGRSGRTNTQGIEALGRILGAHGYDVRPVRVTGCLHLKAAVTDLDDETLLVNPRSVDLGEFSGYRLIQVPIDEMPAANALRVGDAVFVQAGFPKTLELVQRDRHASVIDISEFRKAEAALTCLSILFRGQ